MIEIVPEQLITLAREEEPGAAASPDPARDIAKIAVIERHHATGRVGVGLVSGFGLRSGAFASTVAHDAHNVVVGRRSTTPTSSPASARLQELGGGCVVGATAARCAASWRCRSAGLLSDAPVEDVVARLEALHDAAGRRRASTIEAPFMTLSFLALSVIPALKITDRGLVDVERFEIVPLGVSAS